MNLVLEIATSDEWHVLKGESKFGPYTYGEMIQMMQNKTVFSFDYVWSPHLESWTALGELSEFSAERLVRIKEKSPDSIAFNRRASPRVPVSLEVFCHDNQKFWRGSCESLSLGGGLVLMENPLLLPGHVITIQVRNGEQAFNSTVEILAKRLTKQRLQHDTRLHYAVKFLQLTPTGQQQLQTTINTKLEELNTLKNKN